MISETKFFVTENGRRRELTDLEITETDPVMTPDAEAEYEIWLNGMEKAVTYGPRAGAIREALHYAEIYGQYGRIEIYEVTRKLVTIAELEGMTP